MLVCWGAIVKKIILFEPSIGSNNIGDEIIVNGCKIALNLILQNAFAIEMATHTPLSLRYMHFLNKIDLKFVCGSNIVSGNLNAILHLRQWALSAMTVSCVEPCIFLGVGSQQYNQKINLYSRWAYRKMLRKDVIHSVRDNYTEKALKAIGIENVINTGCPTMWELSSEHCQSIPENKAEEVVVTFTDYKPNKTRDEYILQILRKNYKKVYFWVQGFGDMEYFQTLSGHNEVDTIQPSLKAYDEFLMTHNTDFVGTRLHGGIRAMQKGRRTIIIGVDNRAIELNKDFNIPVLSQENIGNLEPLVHSLFQTQINLPVDNIRKFLGQFGIQY